MSNLDLWNEVEKTNPKYTKKAKVSGVNITAIAPQYQIMQVTEKFGVYGRTWGFKDIKLTYDLVDKFNMVVFRGTFFFPEGEFEIINSCKLYMDRNLTMIDDNFAKKLETDSLTKAISKLGFNADIFMGKFDDVRYVEEMDVQFGNKLPEPTPKKEILSPIAEGKALARIEKGELELIQKLKDKFYLTVEQVTKLDSYVNT